MLPRHRNDEPKVGFDQQAFRLLPIGAASLDAPGKTGLLLMIENWKEGDLAQILGKGVGLIHAKKSTESSPTWIGFRGNAGRRRGR